MAESVLIHLITNFHEAFEKFEGHENIKAAINERVNRVKEHFIGKFKNNEKYETKLNNFFEASARQINDLPNDFLSRLWHANSTTSCLVNIRDRLDYLISDLQFFKLSELLDESSSDPPANHSPFASLFKDQPWFFGKISQACAARVALNGLDLIDPTGKFMVYENESLLGELILVVCESAGHYHDFPLHYDHTTTKWNLTIPWAAIGSQRKFTSCRSHASLPELLRFYNVDVVRKDQVILSCEDCADIGLLPTLLTEPLPIFCLRQEAASSTYRVLVHTGDVLFAGTNANVYLTLFGNHGDSGAKILAHSDKTKNHFVRNEIDTFVFDTLDLGALKSIRVRHDDTGLGSDWYLEKIIVESQADSTEFICGQWLKTGNLECTLIPIHSGHSGTHVLSLRPHAHPKENCRCNNCQKPINSPCYSCYQCIYNTCNQCTGKAIKDLHPLSARHSLKLEYIKKSQGSLGCRTCKKVIEFTDACWRCQHCEKSVLNWDECTNCYKATAIPNNKYIA